MPNANRLTVGIMAMVAEGSRWVAAWRTSKTPNSGVREGRPFDGRRPQHEPPTCSSVIDTIRAEGVTSATGIAKALNERGIPTTRGGRWQAVQVQRILRSTGRVN